MSVRKAALQQLKTTLNALVPGTLKQVIINPKSLEEMRFPGVWIKNGGDVSREMQGVPGNDEDLVATSLIRIVGDLDNETVTEDLEDLIDSVITEIKNAIPTFRSLATPVYITRIQVVSDPDIELERDLGMATIEVEYHN